MVSVLKNPKYMLNRCAKSCSEVGGSENDKTILKDGKASFKPLNMTGTTRLSFPGADGWKQCKAECEKTEVVSIMLYVRRRLSSFRRIRWCRYFSLITFSNRMLLGEYGKWRICPFQFK